MATKLPPFGNVTLVSLLAERLNRAEKKVLKQAELVEAVSEVTLRTQILGASTITITLTDPNWKLQTSGLWDTKKQILTPLEVNFPEGSEMFWRLCMVDGSTDTNGPNLTLTFEDIIVSELRGHHGPRSVPPGTMSRAEFIRRLVNEVSAGGGIRFVCPALKKGLPSATTPVGNKVTTRQNANAFDIKQNKSKGIGNGAKITIKGQKPTTQQLEDLNIALGVADGLNAGSIPTQALIIAGIGESSFDRHAADSVTGTHKGVWQSHLIPADDVAGQAHYFLVGGNSFGAGGAIKLSREVSDPGQIATDVEVSGASASFYSKWLGEAAAIIAAYGGSSDGSQSPNDRLPTNTSGQLSRGTTDNPDEDSWDCASRLAQEVNWRWFSNGNAAYFMDDPQLIAQRPSCYINRANNRWFSQAADDDAVADTVASIRYTVDNTMLTRQLVRGVHVVKPQTPSQITLSLVCGIDEYRAGEVFFFADCGVIDGRWIVSDATRNTLADNFTTFTLIPPTTPTPESEASGTVIAPTNAVGSSARGTGAAAAAAAKKALAQKQNYRYAEVRPMPSSLFGNAPITTDCSGFVTLCYKAAGLDDPNHANYNGSGFTGTLIAHAKRVTDPQPGDLSFYGSSPASSSHVTIHVSASRVISHGQPDDPVELAFNYRSDWLGVYRPDVVS